MSKITIKATPSAEVIEDALKEIRVSDKRGRLITLTKPGILNQYRMVEMLGSEAASNGVFMNMVFPLTFVAAIDGVQVGRMSKRSELDALIQQLDDDGVAAVMDGVQQLIGDGAGKTDESLKNS